MEEEESTKPPAELKKIEKANLSFLDILLLTPLATGFFLLENLLRAICFSKLWKWFFIAKFPNMPQISAIDAFGIMLMFSIILEEVIFYLCDLHYRFEYHNFDFFTRKISISIRRCFNIGFIFALSYLVHEYARLLL
jgi:hypothetical protein